MAALLSSTIQWEQGAVKKATKNRPQKDQKEQVGIGGRETAPLPHQRVLIRVSHLTVQGPVPILQGGQF
jgi:hypothetical protein